MSKARKPPTTAAVITPATAAVEIVGQVPAITELLTRQSHRAEQRAKAVRRSAEARSHKNIERDRRIHDSRGKGEKVQVIARTEKMHHSTVSRILKKPRP